MLPVTFSQRRTTWRVLNLIAYPNVAQRFAKKTRRCELTKGGRYSPSVLHQQSCLYFTICSPCPDPICLMAFTGESNYREWKHSGESQSRHIDTHSLSWTEEKKQPKSFCCNIPPPSKKNTASLCINTSISSPGFQMLLPKYSIDSCRGLSS